MKQKQPKKLYVRAVVCHFITKMILAQMQIIVKTKNIVCIAVRKDNLQTRI